MSEQRKRKTLGRGLDALLGEDSLKMLAVQKNGNEKGNNLVDFTAIENLVPGKYQPRTEFQTKDLEALATSIKENGIIQPIVVRDNINGPEDWEIVAGERRWRAAQMAQLHDVPIVKHTMSDSKALEVALVENLQRENLSPLDEAEAYKKLIEEFSYTPGELGKVLGKSRSHIANMIRLLGLNEEVKGFISAGRLTAGHARALLTAERPLELAKKVVKKGLNVRQTEQLVKQSVTRITRANRTKEKDVDTISLENELSSHLGLRVLIQNNNSRGHVTIEYETLEQFDTIVSCFKNNA